MLRSAICVLMVLVLGSSVAMANDDDKKKVPDALNFKMKTIGGKEVSLSKYKGKMVMFVNVASRCGFTRQYKQLQELHEKYGAKGLAIVGVPCNQFGRQEPGSEEEIQAFCKKNYGVEFDMMAKVDVNGKNQCGLYKYLTSLETDTIKKGKIRWNFEKFIVNKKGEVIARFGSRTSPDDQKIVAMIEKELGAK